MKAYTDALPVVHIAKPLHDGYIPSVQRILLRRFLSETSLPFARDTVAGFDAVARAKRIADFWERSSRKQPRTTRDYLTLKAARKADRAARNNASMSRRLERFGFAGTDSRLGIADKITHKVTFQVGTQDVIVKSVLSGGRSQVGGGVRKPITEFSDKSRSALESKIRNLPEGSIKYFLTLTMPFHGVGQYVKQAESKYLIKLVRQWLQYHGVKDGFWFMEFQGESNMGTVHFHAFLASAPAGGSDAIAAYWAGLVSEMIADPEIKEKTFRNMLAVHTGQANKFSRPCLETVRKPHAASWYAAKYGTKAEQKKPPFWFGTPGRFWAVWGQLRPAWNYVYMIGAENSQRAFAMLQEFARIKGFNPMTTTTDDLGGDVPRSYFTRTMRGAANDFDDWLEMVGLGSAPF